jgi:hypothetical protein
MLKRMLSTGRYLQTLIIAVSILMLGFFLGFYTSEIKMQSMLSRYDDIRLKITGAMLQGSILEGELCNYDVLSMTGKEKVNLGREVQAMEDMRGKTDEQVRRLREDYSLLSLNQLLLVEKWNKECNRNISVIIFFYSNTKNATESEEQGFVLDYIYEKYPDKISTYVFDIDIDNPAVSVLMKKYNVSVIPTLVINEKVYVGFQPREKVERLIQ